MIVTKQVQHAMEQEVKKMVIGGLALRLRLFAHDLRTNHQITEAERSIFKPFHAWERKHVGFSSDAPIRLV